MASTPLPIKPLPRASVEIEGQPVEVRGLSRSEALHLSTRFTQDTADEAEVYILTCGTGVSADEARAFLSQTDATTAGLLIDKIIELSGITAGDADPKK